jgi:hypothetical protein
VPGEQRRVPREQMLVEVGIYRATGGVGPFAFRKQCGDYRWSLRIVASEQHTACKASRAQRQEGTSAGRGRIASSLLSTAMSRGRQRASNATRHGLAGRRVVLPDRRTGEDELQESWLDVCLDCLLEGRGLLALSSACRERKSFWLFLPLTHLARGIGDPVSV